MTKKNKSLFGGLFKPSGCGCGVTVVPEKEEKKEKPTKVATKKDKSE